jgi:prevent-host-death family protein
MRASHGLDGSVEPLVKFGKLRVWFTHMSHANPAMERDGAARRAIEARWFRVGTRGASFPCRCPFDFLDAGSNVFVMARNALRRCTVTVDEVETRLKECLHAAEKGETVVVTRDGSPVAALVPAVPAKQGLAALAGGWEGSEDLVDLTEKARQAARSRSQLP